MSDIRYDAQGRVESETAGNGYVTERFYDRADGRLCRQRVDNGRLQDLNYATDPLGNILRIEDLAQPTRFFANQKIEPLRTFVYDTLYQLTEATGYEAASLNRGPKTAQRTFATADQLSNYTQYYEYDAGGNLQKLIHSGTQKHTRLFATANLSNRSVLQTGEHPPTQEQIAASFDANGNMRELAPGRALSWDARNQLSAVTPVERGSGLNDREIYQYDAAGGRVRKIRSAQAKSISHSDEVRYLPGLEIRSDTATGEVLHVITATAGHGSVRVLHWQAGKPADIDNDQTRYSLADHIGSSTLEVDQRGQLISQEVYYPYGETASFAARSEIQARYKTVRYSGKERDATGLYYYGLRYYAPWLMRWLNTDPKGDVDGFNRFAFVRGNPVSAYDSDGGGLVGGVLEEPDEFERGAEDGGDIKIFYRGVSEMISSNALDVFDDIDTVLFVARELVRNTLEAFRTRQVSVEEFVGLDYFKGVSKIDLNDVKVYKDDLYKAVRVGYEKISDRLARYDGGDLRESLIYAPYTLDVELKQLAFVYPKDPKQRIFFTDALTKRHAVSAASTLIHEVSHLVLGTEDRFYYSKKLHLEGVNNLEQFKSEYTEQIRSAQQDNETLRSQHQPGMHDGLTFNAWLLGNADFWGHFSLFNMKSDSQIEKLHKHSYATHKLQTANARTKTN